MHEFDSFPFDQSSPNLRTLQSAIPASDELIVDFKSAHIVGEDKLISFLQERFFSKNTSMHAPVPLNKQLTFDKKTETTKQGEELKARATEMERSALRAGISLVKVSKLVDLAELLQHRVVEECMALFNSNGTYKKHRKANSSRNFLYNVYSCKSRTLLSSTWACCGECQLHLQKIDRRNTAPHTRLSGRTMFIRCHLSSLPVIVLLNELSV